MPKVRADLGYPPLVTPMSQMVGTQATMNVLTGQRYKVVSNEVKSYLLGSYGQSPVPIQESFRRSIIGSISCKCFEQSAFYIRRGPASFES